MDDPTERTRRRIEALGTELAALKREREAHARRPWLVRVLIPGRFIDRRLRTVERNIAVVERELRGVKREIAALARRPPAS